MKKITAGIIAFTLCSFVLILNNNEESKSFNQEAFADGTCCPEEESLCYLNLHRYQNKYYKSSGSCKSSTPVVEDSFAGK